MTNKKIINNSINLTIIKLLTLAFPVAIIPLLISRVGLDGYGVIALCTAIALYMTTFISFGFEDSATKTVSNGFSNSQSRNEYFSSVIVIKLFHAILGLILIYFLSIIWPEYGVVKYFSLILFAEIFNVLWFSHALNDMKNITVATFLSRLIYLFGVYFLVESEKDIWVVPIIIGCSNMFANFLSYKIICGKYEINLSLNLKLIKQTYKDSYILALTNCIPLFKDKLGTVLLAVFLSPASVGIYDILMKILNLMFIPINITVSSFFPILSNNFDCKLFYKQTKLVMLYSVFIVLVACICSPIFINLYYIDYISYVTSFYVISISVIFYSISLTLAKNLFIVKGKYKYVMVSLIVSTVFFLVGVCCLALTSNISIFYLTCLTTSSFFVEAIIRVYMMRTILNEN
ncbi:oligosaccharide flippase family protein [Shewanella sp. 125m-1]